MSGRGPISRRSRPLCTAGVLWGTLAAVLWITVSRPILGEGGEAGEIARVVEEVAPSGEPSIVRAERLLHWMNEEFTWTTNDYTSRSVEEILERRAGHCGEMAWVLQTLLEEAEIGVRVVQEINIHPPSEERRADAEKLVAERGKSYSVFGYLHNDHRWLEVRDDSTGDWIPADPTLDLFGMDDWIAGRMGFGSRPRGASEMIVPVVVLARTEGGLEDRSRRYLVDGFAAHYGGGLTGLAAWPEWTAAVESLRDVARGAFAGEVDLHQHLHLLERAERAYRELERQYKRSVERGVRD